MRHITVIHPSRGRAGLCYKSANSIISSADNRGHLNYVFCIEFDQVKDYCTLINDLLETHAIASNSGYVPGHSNNAIEAINSPVEIYNDWRTDIIIVVSDDFVLPKGWDTMIREAVVDKTDFVLKTFDTTQKWICTLPIMDRVYYDRFGYVYNPGYKHMFADTELTHVAELFGKLIVRNDIVFPHRTEVTGNDAINKKNNSTWEQGEALYLQRVKENFGLPEELRKPVSYKPHQQWINQKIK